MAILKFKDIPRTFRQGTYKDMMGSIEDQFYNCNPSAIVITPHLYVVNGH